MYKGILVADCQFAFANFEEGRILPQEADSVLNPVDQGIEPYGLLGAALDAVSAHVAIVDESGAILAVNRAWRRFADANGLQWPDHAVGSNYLAVLDGATGSEDDPAWEAAEGIRQVLAGTRNYFWLEYGCHIPGRPAWYIMRAAHFVHDGRRLAVISHEDITAKKTAEEELRRDKAAAEHKRLAAEVRQQVAETVTEILTALNTSQSLQDLLQTVAARASLLLHSQAAGIYQATGEQGEPTLLAARGYVSPVHGTGLMPVDPAILARAMNEHRALGVSDIEPSRRPPSRPPTARAKTGETGYASLLIAPVLLHTRLFGYLVLFYTEPRAFASDEIEIAHLFGHQIGLALENAELRKQAAYAAVEAERGRLARELHDAVTQTIFSASVMAEALPRVWDRDPAEGRRALEELRQWTRGALAEMRALLMELRPAALVEKPFPDLLRQLGEAATTRMGIAVDLTCDCDGEPPTNVKLALYRIAQEALNNVAKHSRASHVTLECRCSPRQAFLNARDDGQGFEPGMALPGHLGIDIMRERADSIAAKLAIESTPGEGTQVSVQWQANGRRPSNGKV